MNDPPLLTFSQICGILDEDAEPWRRHRIASIESAVDRAARMAAEKRAPAFILISGYPRRGVVVEQRPQSGHFWTVTPGGALLGARP